MLNRRSFLATMGVTAVAATLDPEKMLWIPGSKTISIPKLILAPDGPLVRLAGCILGHCRCGKYHFTVEGNPYTLRSMVDEIAFLNKTQEQYYRDLFDRKRRT